MRDLRILVVDDDRDFNEGLVGVLAMRGHVVESAYGGREAIAKCRDAEFDVALIDLSMPDINGVDSFRQIRGFRPSLCAIMLTGYSTWDDCDMAGQDGVCGVLHKPFDPQRVLDMLEEIGAQCGGNRE